MKYRGVAIFVCLVALLLCYAIHRATATMTGAARLRAWTTQLSTGQNASKARAEIHSPGWGRTLFDTPDTSSAAIAFIDALGVRMSASGVANVLMEIDTSGLSRQTKIEIAMRLLTRFDRTLVPGLYECFMHLGKGERDAIYDDLVKVTYWRDFKVPFADALVISGDARAVPVLLDQQLRLQQHGAPSTNMQGELDTWNMMNNAASVLLEYAHAQTSQASLLAALYGDTSIGKSPGSPQSIWAMRR